MQPLDIPTGPRSPPATLRAIAPAADPMPSRLEARQALPRCAPRTPHPSNGASAAVASIQAVHDQLRTSADKKGGEPDETRSRIPRSSRRSKLALRFGRP